MSDSRTTHQQFDVIIMQTAPKFYINDLNRITRANKKQKQ